MSKLWLAEVASKLNLNSVGCQLVVASYRPASRNAGGREEAWALMVVVGVDVSGSCNLEYWGMECLAVQYGEGPTVLILGVSGMVWLLNDYRRLIRWWWAGGELFLRRAELQLLFGEQLGSRMHWGIGKNGQTLQVATTYPTISVTY
jgi:hypothetical protein